jgi:hypothetical protein
VRRCKRTAEWICSTRFPRTLGGQFVALRVSAISAVCFFDTLTQWKLWWVSRYREKTSYQIAHVFYRQREGKGALVWLGTGQKQARHLLRLVRFGDGIGVRMYLTNVCDPQVLSLAGVAQLYARSFDIELAFRLRKRVSGHVALVE